MITTAAAAVSVQNTTAEMQAAGRERMLMHARYAAEAALVATISWIDNQENFKDTWDAWQAGAAPDLRAYTAGHNVPAIRHHAAVITQRAEIISVGGVQPVSSPDLAAAIPDLTGSFGPNQSYSMQNYVVDITDCSRLVFVAGTQVGGQRIKFSCALTVRGRLVINGGGAGVSWNIAGFPQPIFQDRTGAAHDARAMIETPNTTE